MKKNENKAELVNKPIYREGTSYAMILAAAILEKGKITFAKAVAIVKGKKFHRETKTVSAAQADVTVVFSPKKEDSERGKLGNSLGNRSANGVFYFVEREGKGDARTFSIHICTPAEVEARKALMVKRDIQVKIRKTKKSNGKPKANAPKANAPVAKVVKVVKPKMAKAPKAVVQETAKVTAPASVAATVAAPVQAAAPVVAPAAAVETPTAPAAPEAPKA